jgi:signal transduction histidine kinase
MARVVIENKTQTFRTARTNPHDNMKQKLAAFSKRYMSVLEKHLKQGPQASLQPALGLGREAAALGLGTLELARIHEQALANFELSHIKNGFTKLAGIFFTEASTPIVEMHRAARQGKAQLNRLEETLGERTEELAKSNRQLQQGIVRRKVMEQAAEEKNRHHQKSLEESLMLQKRLRQLTHRVIAAQEDDRKKISRELQDEIVQTLLGINVRLLSLKRCDQCNTNGLQNEIASTQRLVAKSAQYVRRFARELNTRQEANNGSLVPAH